MGQAVEGLAGSQGGKDGLDRADVDAKGGFVSYCTDLDHLCR
jgi:hypothetical protein